MKIVVIGGTGLIGAKLVAKLEEAGHETVAAAPNTGVNTITGEGLTEALTGAQVVVDVSNSPSFEDAAVLEFFRTSTANLLAAAKAAGARHYVALSVVGTQLLAESGYFRAKIAQEELIVDGEIPFTIVHATQFFEFVGSMAGAGTIEGKVHAAPVRVQPMASDDVAAAVARVALAEPANGTVQIAGPQELRLDEFLRLGLESVGDPRTVVGDPAAKYFGAALHEWTLVPGDGDTRSKAQLGATTFADWLAHNTVRV